MHGTGDDIFLLQSNRKFVPRISAPTETAENPECQNSALCHLAAMNLNFVAPEVVPGLEGHLTEIVIRIGCAA